MQWKTKEMTITHRDDNIIMVKINEGCNELTVEDTQECIYRLHEIFKLDDEPKAIVFWVAHFYVKKDVLKNYSKSEFGEVAVALVCHSFIAKFVGSIALKMRERFVKSEVSDQRAPVKIFGEEEKALEWLRQMILENKK